MSRIDLLKGDNVDEKLEDFISILEKKEKIWEWT